MKKLIIILGGLLVVLATFFGVMGFLSVDWIAKIEPFFLWLQGREPRLLHLKVIPMTNKFNYYIAVSMLIFGVLLICLGKMRAKTSNL